MCEDVDTFLWATAPGVTLALQRSWSNAAAAAGHDPCVGDGAVPYYQTIPEAPDADDVMVTVDGSDPFLVHTHLTKIGVGSSGTVTMHVFADQADAGPFTVDVEDISGDDPALLDITEPTGTFNPGDAVTFTVVVNGGDASVFSATAEPYVVIADAGGRRLGLGGANLDLLLRARRAVACARGSPRQRGSRRSRRSRRAAAAVVAARRGWRRRARDQRRSSPARGTTRRARQSRWRSIASRAATTRSRASRRSSNRAAAAWLDARVAVCEAEVAAGSAAARAAGSAAVRAVGSASAAGEVAVGERACLRDWRRELAALTSALAAATPEAVAHAHAAVTELPPLAACTDAAAIARRPAPPTGDDAARIDALADRLATARSAAVAGKPGDALAIADDVMAAPELARAPSLAIAGELARADWLTASGRLDDARMSATHAYELALGIGDDRAQLLAAAAVAELAAYDSTRVPDARHWLHTAQVLLARLDGERDLEARVAQVEGTVEIVAGVPATAAPALALAVADYRKLDPDHPSLGAALALLGSAEVDLGKVADAERDLRDALAHERRDLGDDSPEIASAMINLALAQAARGFYADASRSLDDALALQARVLGGDNVARAYAYLARVEVDKGRGDRDAAARDVAEAGRIARAAFGDQGQLVAQVTLAAAELDADAGRGADAVAAARRGRELSAGLDDGNRALADATLARALAAAGQSGAAVALAKAAMARVDDVRVTSSTRALVATTYGELLLARGDAAGAVPPLREAEAAFVEGTPSPWRLVRTRFALARALAATDRAAGIDEAKLALGDAPRDGEAAVRAEIETWIAKK